MFHDVGGESVLEPLEVIDNQLSYWEKSIHALLVCLSKSNYITTDELRRGVEGLEEQSYLNWGYYDRWAAAMTRILLERGVITEAEINHELGYDDDHDATGTATAPLFHANDRVDVKPEDTRCRWRKPHLRIPGYIYGARGTIERYIGSFHDPFLLAFRGQGLIL